MAGPFHSLDVICSRRQALIYVSPPFCEVDFSSTSEPVIVLTPFRRRRGPTGFAASVVDGRIRFRWDTSDGAICYSLYRSEGGTYVLVAECIGDCVDGECTFFCDDCGPGTYVVTVITADGESETSDEVTVGGFAPECPDVGGQPVPTGTDAFDIDSPVEWEEIQIDNPCLLEKWPLPTSNAYRLVLEDDYPPGHYDVAFVTGSWGIVDPFGCAPDDKFLVHLQGMKDDNHQGIADDITRLIYEVNPPNTVTAASGLSTCAPNFTTAETFFQAYWNGSTPRRFMHQERHDNDGGDLFFTFDEGVTGDPCAFIPGPTFELTYQLVQTDGLIQQPRQIRVQGWQFVKSDFSVGVQSWDGVFTERTTYESDELVYTAPPSGAFAGATAYYVAVGHPTSPNGAGWVVDIFFAPATIEWTGLKTIDNQAIGQYKRTVGSPNNPPCIVLEEVPDEP